MGLLWCLVCIVCWGAWAITQRMAGMYLSPMGVQLATMCSCAILALGFGAAVMSNHTPWSTPGVLWSALGAILSAIACVSYLHAIRVTPVYFVTGVTATYPVMTLFLSWLYLGEQVTAVKLIGVFVIVAGTVLLQA